MLDRKVVKEFLDHSLKDSGIRLPGNISEKDILEVFCRYVEDDYYDWLKDNFNTFFQHNNKREMNWGWIRNLIGKLVTSQ